MHKTDTGKLLSDALTSPQIRCLPLSVSTHKIEPLDVSPSLFSIPRVFSNISRILRPGDCRASLSLVINNAPRSELSAFKMFHLVAPLSMDFSIQGRSVCEDLSCGISSTPLHHFDENQNPPTILFETTTWYLTNKSCTK